MPINIAALFSNSFPFPPLPRHDQHLALTVSEQVRKNIERNFASTCMAAMMASQQTPQGLLALDRMAQIMREAQQSAEQQQQEQVVRGQEQPCQPPHNDTDLAAVLLELQQQINSR
jgi:hypothetical protein